MAKPFYSPQPKKHLLAIARSLILLGSATTAILLLLISSSSMEPSMDLSVNSIIADKALMGLGENIMLDAAKVDKRSVNGVSSCATVEEMGEVFAKASATESLTIRNVIRRHFFLHGPSTVRGLPPDQFCREGFVLGKASEAGFGNEMYKILSAAALSIMLNRSLIIGQTRGFYPFEDFISYTNHSFTLKEVKHLWRKNDCAGKYGRRLIIRLDNFERPSKTNVLCGDLRIWEQPIIWLQGTTDAVAIQFFLKNINLEMRKAASALFGDTRFLNSRPNVFGELFRFIVAPSPAILDAVNWVLKGKDPDISLHMRMLTNRSERAIKAALMCVKKAMHSNNGTVVNPRIVLISDTPSFIKEIAPNLTEFAEVLHFDYKLFERGDLSSRFNEKEQSPDFRARDWGPAPRWVAFVDFFLASRAKYAVISGAHRRVGTTYAQLIAALAAANRIGEDDEANPTGFSFLSSFQSNLLADGLANQRGWGHAWNRFAGPLSCAGQPHQCALSPLLPPAWWDAEWQSPSPPDIRRMHAYGVDLTKSGDLANASLLANCQNRRVHVQTVDVL